MSKDRTPEEVAEELSDRIFLAIILPKDNRFFTEIAVPIIAEAIRTERTRSAEKDAEIAKLRGELQSQAEVMEKMREALEFYAHENNYDDETGAIGRYVGGGHIAGEIYEPHFEPEYGETAKKVLALLMPNSVSRLEKKDNPHA